MNRFLIGTLLTLGVLAGATLVTSTSLGTAAIATKEPKRPQYFRRMKKEVPRIVIIGNSVPDSSIDEDVVNEMLQIPTMKLANAGTASAAWYLLFKNLVTQVRRKPEVVVFCFREVYLTEPTYRTGGKNYRRNLDSLSLLEEPVLERLAYAADLNPLEHYLSTEWPLYKHRVALRDSTETMVTEKVAARLLGLEKKKIDKTMDRVFADRHMDQELLNVAQAEAEVGLSLDDHFDFDRQLDKSFLPHIVRMAEESGIRLIMVRLRTRRDADVDAGTAEPEEYGDVLLPSYLAKFEAYLEQHDIPLVDFSADKRITPEFYSSDDHFNWEVGRAAFTPMFVDSLRPHLDAMGVVVKKGRTKVNPEKKQ